MNPELKARLIQLLEEDVRDWEEAAARCNFLAGHVVGDKQKEQLKAEARRYRASAEKHHAFINLVKQD